MAESMYDQYFVTITIICDLIVTVTHFGQQLALGHIDHKTHISLSTNLFTPHIENEVCD